ncbi:MAG: N-6 DNA methylase [Terracidiphilus sp.]
MLFLPLNLFYNTGIATYIWVLTNRKPEHRRGQVQLIDATQWSKPLRKNLGKKNCELSPEDIETICKAYLDFAPTEQSKIFSNAAFGYWKVTVERPLRLYSQLTLKAIETLRFASGDEELRSAIYDEFGDTLHTDFATVEAKLTARLSEWGSDENGDSEEEDAPKRTLPEKKKRKLLDAKTWERDGRLVETATLLREELGGGLYEDHNHFRGEVAAALDRLGRKVSATDLKAILQAVSWRVETAPPVIAKVYKAGKAEANPMYGLYEAEIDGKRRVVEYEPDSELRDTEQVSFLEAPESGQLGGLPTDATTREGVERFIRREVLPYVPDAWIRDDWKVGYEISFTRHFYKPQPLRSLEEIRADIVALEEETDGLLEEVLAGGAE